MTYQYQRPVSTGGLRLHLNENTAGCSPRVMEALRELTREEAALYPDYDQATAAAATAFGVAPEHVLLTNGLDEGILLAAMVTLRDGSPAEPLEAVIVQPAFDMYAACTDAMGGRVVDVPPRSDFAFSVEDVGQAITPRTRIVFLANPNNPTGLSIHPDTVAAVARAAPDACIFLDEAYADFSGASMMDAAASGAIPNLVVGRTFAKAHGLAGLRAGAVVGTARYLEPMRRAIPPYSLNVFAAAALPAALADEAYYDWYRSEVRASKQLLYDVLARHSVQFWPSDGNFVLACFGPAVGGVIAGVADRGIIIRDRSGDPGCAGCARITAGVLDHTRRVVAALEEVLCGAR